MGANVKEINGILDSPELNRPEGKTSLSDEKICLKQVSFSYGNQDEKVLKGVNLTINREQLPHWSDHPVPENPPLQN